MVERTVYGVKMGQSASRLFRNRRDSSRVVPAARRAQYNLSDALDTMGLRPIAAHYQRDSSERNNV